MAVARSEPYTLKFGSTLVPFRPEALKLGNDLQTEDLELAGHTKTSLVAVMGRKPFIACQIMDLSVIDDIEFIPGDIASVVATFRDIDQNGTYSAGYDSYTISKGVVVPVSLQAEAGKVATMDIRVVALFASGSAVVKATTASSTLANGIAYELKYFSLSTGVGSAVSTYTNVRSATLNWDIPLEDDEQSEPEYIYYKKRSISGKVVIRGLSQASQDRLEDGQTNTACNLVFQDVAGTAADKTFTLGRVFTQVETNGADVEISFKQIQTPYVAPVAP